MTDKKNTVTASEGDFEIVAFAPKPKEAPKVEPVAKPVEEVKAAAVPVETKAKTVPEPEEMDEEDLYN